jgi:pimeloyl-ACP methyl ester carboxylesterase
MADYANLITFLKSEYQISHVILNGGSYGAMLSAWMRIKYPQLITGALACSAPLI